MKPFPFTRVCGALAVVSGVVYKYTESAHPQVAYWSDLVFKCTAALGIWFARNNKTTSEEAGAAPTPPKP